MTIAAAKHKFCTAVLLLFLRCTKIGNISRTQLRALCRRFEKSRRNQRWEHEGKRTLLVTELNRVLNAVFHGFSK